MGGNRVVYLERKLSRNIKSFITRPKHYYSARDCFRANVIISQTKHQYPERPVFGCCSCTSFAVLLSWRLVSAEDFISGFCIGVENYLLRSDITKRDLY